MRRLASWIKQIARMILSLAAPKSIEIKTQGRTSKQQTANSNQPEQTGARGTKWIDLLTANC
jgi:hypothetical protein